MTALQGRAVEITYNRGVRRWAEAERLRDGWGVACAQHKSSRAATQRERGEAEFKRQRHRISKDPQKYFSNRSILSES